jgi:arylsulfatase A-like enzyme
MESGRGEPPTAVVRKGKWKLVHYRSADEARQRGREIELFDLEDDPGELRNIAARHSDVVGELRAALDHWARSTPSFGQNEVETNLDDLDEGTKEMMRALGYLD